MTCCVALCCAVLCCAVVCLCSVAILAQGSFLRRGVREGRWVWPPAVAIFARTLEGLKWEGGSSVACSRPTVSGHFTTAHSRSPRRRCWTRAELELRRWAQVDQPWPDQALYESPLVVAPRTGDTRLSLYLLGLIRGCQELPGCVYTEVLRCTLTEVRALSLGATNLVLSRFASVSKVFRRLAATCSHVLIAQIEQSLRRILAHPF